MYVPHSEDNEEHDAGIETSENTPDPVMKKPVLLSIVAGSLLIVIAGTATWWYFFRDSADLTVVTPKQPTAEAPADGADNDIPGSLPEPDAEAFSRMTNSSDGEYTAETSERESTYIPLASSTQNEGTMELVMPATETSEYQLPPSPVSDDETYSIGDMNGTYTLTDEDGQAGRVANVDSELSIGAGTGIESGGRLPGGHSDNLPGFNEPAPFLAPATLDAEGSLGDSSSPDTPGRFQLEGKQLPMLAIEKHAPSEVQVNRTAAFTTTVKNVGTVAAHRVTVTDFIPRGTTLDSTTPASTQGVDGALVWSLGTLQPGEEAIVSMKLIPRQEGDIGSVAMVNFQAEASVRTISTRPQLVLQQSAAEQVLIGQDITIAVTVSNPGSGDATSVVLEADIPIELRHAAGSELEFPIGTLRAGETRQLKLKLHAASAGQVLFPVVARGDGQLLTRNEIAFEVIAPELQVNIQGPRIRYLDRPATHTVKVGNTGTATAYNISLVMQLPRALKFVSTDHHGRYEPQQHSVYWQLEELPSNVLDAVTITTIPMEVGNHIMKLDGKADLGISDRFEHAMRVESVPQLSFTIADKADPIEEGSDTTYEIRVVNKGTRTATNVLVTAGLPPQMRPIDGSGPTDAKVDGQQIIFAPLDRLAPEAEVVYHVQVRGIKAGDHVIRVQIISDDTRVPVAKEESTRVYADN